MTLAGSDLESEEISSKRSHSAPKQNRETDEDNFLGQTQCKRETIDNRGNNRGDEKSNQIWASGLGPLQHPAAMC
jgi:hypothetical protein